MSVWCIIGTHDWYIYYWCITNAFVKQYWCIVGVLLIYRWYTLLMLHINDLSLMYYWSIRDALLMHCGCFIYTLLIHLCIASLMHCLYIIDTFLTHNIDVLSIWLMYYCCIRNRSWCIVHVLLIIIDTFYWCIIEILVLY